VDVGGAGAGHFQQVNGFCVYFSTLLDVFHYSINFEQGIFAPSVECGCLEFLAEAIVPNLLKQPCAKFSVILGQEPFCLPLARMAPVLARYCNSKHINLQILIGMIKQG
jgi:hypothetical protein